MSDRYRRAPFRRHRRRRGLDATIAGFRDRFRRDDGVTLPELLVGIALIGIVMAAISSAIIVVVRQADNTEGRLNNARSENNVGLWMPGDLASAAENADGKLVVTDPAASPCFGPCPPGISPEGSNALLVEWSTTVSDGSDAVQQKTRVSYRYAERGDEYVLVRWECTVIGSGAQNCSSTVVLHDLDAPPTGIFEPGVTIPSWIIAVKDPYKPEATDESQTDPGLISKNASRVVVTINGGGDSAGAGGGSNQISISAGGTNRTDIDATSVQGAPSLIAARSRCGGAITMIIDLSNSIGDAAILKLRSAVTDFINLFSGTPVKLQLVTFASKSNVLGLNATNTYNRYFDMLAEDDVAELRGLANTLAMNGSTNWEDALHRTFYQSNGTIQSVLPGLVVFFTDGVPTYSRLNSTSATAATDPPARLPGYSLAGGSSYNQEAYYRANEIASKFRDSIRFIGIGVGPDINSNQTWINSIPGWHYEYARNYHLGYLRWYHIERSFHYERVNTYDLTRGYHVEKFVRFQTRATTSSSWVNATENTYSGQTNSNLRRTVDTQTSSAYTGWVTDESATTSTTLGSSGSTIRRLSFAAPFLLSRTSISGTSAPTAEAAQSWSTTSTSPYATNNAAYNAQNIGANGDADGSDGWTRSVTSWSDVTLATYNATAAWDRRITVEDPVGNTSLDYWEVDPTATAATSLGAGKRVSFTAPFSFSREVTMSAAPIKEGATSWSTTSTSPYTTNQATYNAQNIAANGDTNNADGWTYDKVYASPYTLVDPLTIDSTGFVNDSSWTRTKVYSLPFTNFDSANTSSVKSSTILARLITGTDTGIQGTLTGGVYTNAKVANMYISPSWDLLDDVMRAVALSECGGTLTIQTRLGTKAAPDPFTYQKSKLWNSAGSAVTSDQTVVTTTRTYPSGTFDLATETYVDVEVQPVNLSDLTGYNAGTWSCKAGSTTVPVTLVNIPGSDWKGIKVRVAANQAVSCTQTVTR